MKITLQHSGKEDLPRIERYARAYHAIEGVADFGDETTRAIELLLGQSPFGRIWRICLEDEPVGYVAVCFGYSIEFAGCDAFIDEMFVVEEHRGRGIGGAAIRLIKTQAAELGIKAIHLEVAHINSTAQRLYRSAGFVPRERFSLMSAVLDSCEEAPSEPLVHDPELLARAENGLAADITRKLVSANVGWPLKLDNTRSRRELGLEYRPVEQTLHEHFQQMIDDGLLRRR